jgi:hypothetical protein
MNTRSGSVLKIIFSIIYVIGIICVVVFSGMYLQHSTIVPYPDAMLPMMKYEIAAWRLLIGFPFMAASCISIVLAYKLRKVTKMILVSLPAVVCLVMCVSFFII